MGAETRPCRVIFALFPLVFKDFWRNISIKGILSLALYNSVFVNLMSHENLFCLFHTLGSFVVAVLLLLFMSKSLYFRLSCMLFYCPMQEGRPAGQRKSSKRGLFGWCTSVWQHRPGQKLNGLGQLSSQMVRGRSKFQLAR